MNVTLEITGAAYENETDDELWPPVDRVTPTVPRPAGRVHVTVPALISEIDVHALPPTLTDCELAGPKFVPASVSVPPPDV